MISDAKRDANRKNALKSTGPKTAEGKARSSRNAETHGLTALAQPGDPSPAYREALAEWVGDLKPRGILERTLTERACRAAWNLRRCDRHEDAVAFQRDRDAAEEFTLAEANRAEAIGRRLVAFEDPDTSEWERGGDSWGRGRHDRRASPRRGPGTSGELGGRPLASDAADDPALLVADLRRSAAGVSWLLARWGELGRALRAPEGWSEPQWLTATRLMGLRQGSVCDHPLLWRVRPRSTVLPELPGGASWLEHPEMGDALGEAIDAGEQGLGDPHTVWLDRMQAIVARERGETEDSVAADRKQLRALVRSEREKLARLLRRVLKARGDEDRAGAADRAMFEDSKSLSLCLRYASANSRDFHRAIRDLIKLREEDHGDEDDSPQPPSASGDGPDSGPPAKSPDEGASPLRRDEEKLRNEATEGATTVQPDGPENSSGLDVASSQNESHRGGVVDAMSVGNDDRRRSVASSLRAQHAPASRRCVGRSCRAEPSSRLANTENLSMTGKDDRPSTSGPG